MVVGLQARAQEIASPGVLGSLGGRESVLGVMAVAGMVALPTGIPLSEVLVRWVPLLHGVEHVTVAVGVTATVWLSMVWWLLQGVHAYLVRAGSGASMSVTTPVPVRVRQSPARRRRARVTVPLAAAH
jgi:hypothetical protein